MQKSFDPSHWVEREVHDVLLREHQALIQVQSMRTCMGTSAYIHTMSNTVSLPSNVVRTYTYITKIQKQQSMRSSKKALHNNVHKASQVYNTKA